MIDATSGDICVLALIVCDSSTGGFVRAGLIAWMPTTRTTKRIATIFRTVRMNGQFILRQAFRSIA